MFSIQNIINFYMFIFGLNFQEKGPGFSENNESQTENTESIPEQVFGPEQKEIMEQLDRLEKKYDTLINTQKISKGISDRLLHGLKSDPEIQKDPEAQPTIDMFQYYRNQYMEALTEATDIDKKMNELKQRIAQVSNSLEHEAGVDYNDKTGEVEELDVSKEELSNISNIDFLSISPEKRLQYITKNNIDSTDISNGNVDSIKFTFTFDGEFNRELYMKTTAGHVLPKEVGEVQVDGKTYSRNNLHGEFFSGNNRLTIHDGTSLLVTNLRTPEDIQNLETQNNQKTNEFLENNPDSNQLISSEAVKRGIEPSFANLAFGELLEGKSEEESIVILEDAMTEFYRYRGRNNISDEIVDGKYNYHLAVNLFAKYTENWKEKSEEYGVSQNFIENFESNGELNMSIDAESIKNADSLPEGGYLKGDKLLENPEFSQRLDEVCSSIGANREDLIKVMKAESSLDPRNVNPYSDATGLIQFMPDTAEGLGTNIGSIRAMTAVEQLDYVEKYFEQNSMGKSLDSIEKLYQAVFYPLSLTKPTEFIFGSEESSSRARLVAEQNGVISRHSTRSDGLIDGYAFSRYVNNRVSKFSV